MEPEKLNPPKKEIPNLEKSPFSGAIPSTLGVVWVDDCPNPAAPKMYETIMKPYK